MYDVQSINNLAVFPTLKFYTEYEQNICHFGLILHEIDTFVRLKGNPNNPIVILLSR
jgi:hypothetical protein